MKLGKATSYLLVCSIVGCTDPDIEEASTLTAAETGSTTAAGTSSSGGSSAESSADDPGSTATGTDATDDASGIETEGDPTATIVKLASLESDDPQGEFDLWNPANATLEVTTERAYDGRHSAHAQYGGGGGNAFARGVQEVSWSTGDEVWYGMALFLPSGFLDAMQGQVSLIRWDNFPHYARTGESNIGGVVINQSDKRARVVLGQYDAPQQLMLVGPWDIPEDEWVWLEVHQRFSPVDGEAWTAVSVNGELVGSSTAPNTYGYEIERIRYGLVALSEEDQTNGLELWFDRASITTGAALGPR